MYIPDNILSKLELNLIIEEFTGLCVLESSRQIFRNAKSFTSPAEYIDFKDTVEYYRYRISSVFSFSSYNISESDLIMKRLLSKTEQMEIEDINPAANLLLLAEDFSHLDNDYFMRIASREIDRNFVHDYRKYLSGLIDDDGTMKDSASTELKAIRTERRRLERSQSRIIKQTMDKYADILMMQSITLSDSRMVLQVKANKKNELHGILHDYSATQKTAFIEPEEFVNYNNELTETIGREKEEIARILSEIKKKLMMQSGTMETIIHFAIRTDYINAISLYMDTRNAIFPELSDRMILKNAYNPVLKKVKPNDTKSLSLIIDTDKSLLITGPNMGGKTVILKTIGLFAVMTRMGLPVICERGTKMIFYDSVFADIGDDQSITEGISTFASHMRNYRQFAMKAGGNTLVLLDEIGTGTSVKEGAGFAIAMIEYMIQNGSTVIFTSHFDAIKEFAMHNPRVTYASMTFDGHTNRPLYELELGTIGQSGVMNMIRQYEFPKEIIKRSEQIIGTDYVDYTKIVQEYRDKIRDISGREKTIINQKKAIDRLKEIIEDDKETIEKKVKRIDKEYALKKNEELANIRAELEHLIKDIRESQASKDTIRKTREFIESSFEEIPAEEDDGGERPYINIGDTVNIGEGTEGIVQSIDDNRVVININGITVDTTLAKITKVSVKQKEQQVSVRENSSIDSNEIDVRGLYPEDAIYELEAYIRKAVSAGLEEVLIIHGHGTGVLKREIRKWLKKQKYVKDSFPGMEYPGGDGVTVAKL